MPGLRRISKSLFDSMKVFKFLVPMIAVMGVRILIFLAEITKIKIVNHGIDKCQVPCLFHQMNLRQRQQYFFHPGWLFRQSQEPLPRFLFFAVFSDGFYKETPGFFYIFIIAYSSADSEFWPVQFHPWPSARVKIDFPRHEGKRFHQVLPGAGLRIPARIWQLLSASLHCS